MSQVDPGAGFDPVDLEAVWSSNDPKQLRLSRIGNSSQLSFSASSAEIGMTEMKVYTCSMQRLICILWFRCFGAGEIDGKHRRPQ